MMREKLQKVQIKRLVILNLPYFFIFYVADKGSWLYRHCLGESMVQRLGVMLVNFRLAFLSWLPSIALQDLMAFFSSAINILQTLVVAIGAGLGVWGVINLMEGYGNDNPGAKSQGIKQLMSGGGVILIGTQLIPLLSGLFG